MDECCKLDIDIDDNYSKENSADLKLLIGDRTELVTKYSKYSDLVVTAIPRDES